MNTRGFFRERQPSLIYDSQAVIAREPGVNERIAIRDPRIPRGAHPMRFIETDSNQSQHFMAHPLAFFVAE